MPLAARRTILAAGLAFAPVVAAAGAALAQGKLEASYTISVARIPVGNITFSAGIGAADYTISMTGRASGVLRVLASGEATSFTVGTIRDGRLTPSRYTSRATADDDTLDVTMTFEDGNVKDLTVSAPPPAPDRVDAGEDLRRQVVDPLTAILIPAPDGGVAEAACQRTLAIFDGRRRYDLKLAFKRIDTVKAERGYAGPAVVCAVAFQPIAGHRRSSPLVNFLSEGRDVEMTFVPIAGARVLAPFRVTVVNMLGNIMVQASRFEVLAAAPAPVSPSTGRAQWAAGSLFHHASIHRRWTSFSSLLPARLNGPKMAACDARSSPFAYAGSPGAERRARTICRSPSA